MPRVLPFLELPHDKGMVTETFEARPPSKANLRTRIVGIGGSAWALRPYRAESPIS